MVPEMVNFLSHSSTQGGLDVKSNSIYLGGDCYGHVTDLNSQKMCKSEPSKSRGPSQVILLYFSSTKLKNYVR